jgi:hypothetical protein
MTRILALDQASRISGWCVFIDGELKEWGHLITDQEDIGERLVDYRKHIEKLICDNDIEEVAFEDI